MPHLWKQILAAEVGGLSNKGIGSLATHATFLLMILRNECRYLMSMMTIMTTNRTSLLNRGQNSEQFLLSAFQ